MKDVVDHLLENIRYRSSNVFMFSFGATLIVSNYKLLVVLLSDVNFNEKFEYIDLKLYPDNWSFYLHLALIPLASALFFSFVWPFIDGLIERTREVIFNYNTKVRFEKIKRRYIDIDEKAAHYDAIQQDVANFKSRHLEEVRRETEKRKSVEIAYRKLQDRLKRTALSRLSDIADTSVENVITLLTKQSFQIRESSLKDIAAKIGKSRQLINISKIIQEAKKLNPDNQHNRNANSSWIQGILNIDEADAICFVDLLFALGIVSDFHEPENTFTFNPEMLYPSEALQTLLSMGTNNPK